MRISNEKINKIKSNLLIFLYQSFPKAPFTVEISRNEARDEEFIKKLLLELKYQGLVVQVKKNNDGVDYSRRMRWRLSAKAYDAYKKLQ